MESSCFGRLLTEWSNKCKITYTKESNFYRSNKESSYAGKSSIRRSNEEKSGKFKEVRIPFGHTIPIRGQFHQPTGVKRKCAGAQHLAQKDAVQFHQQNCAQLYWSIEVENPPNFYAVRFAPYASNGWA